MGERVPLYYDILFYDDFVIKPSSREKFKFVLENFILNNLDVHTQLSVCTSIGNPPDDEDVDPVGIDFVVSRVVQQLRPPFELVYNISNLDQLNDKDINDLRLYMSHTGMISQSEHATTEDLRSFRWTKDDILALVCPENGYHGMLTLTKDDYCTLLQVEELDATDEIDENDKVITYLGQNNDDTNNPLDLVLPIHEPMRRDEERGDFLRRVRRSQAFWENRIKVWKTYVRTNRIDEGRFQMVPDLFAPHVFDPVAPPG